MENKTTELRIANAIGLLRAINDPMHTSVPETGPRHTNPARRDDARNASAAGRAITPEEARWRASAEDPAKLARKLRTNRLFAGIGALLWLVLLVLLLTGTIAFEPWVILTPLSWLPLLYNIRRIRRILQRNERQ